MRRWGLIFFAIFLSAGCVAYHPRPLDEAQHEPALRPIDPTQIRLATEAIHHPLLPSLAIDVTRPISPDAVALLAVALQPQLRAARTARAVAHAQVLQAGMLPNPQFAIALDRPMDPAFVTARALALSWDVSALIGRGARQNAAHANAAAVDLGIAWQEWQVAQGAKLAAWRAVISGQQADAADQLARAATTHAQRVDTGVSAHLRSALDADLATAAQRDATTAAANAHTDTARARRTLNRLVGVPADTALQLDPEAFRLPPTTPSDVASMTVLADNVADRRLDLLALRQGYKSQEETVRAAVLAQFPKFGLGLQRARDTSAVQTRGVGASIDLPLFDRNQAGIANEQATRERLFDEYAARLFEARADIADALADLTSVQQQQVAASDVVTQQTQRVSALRGALAKHMADADTVSFAEMVLAQRHLDTLRLTLQAVEARLAFELAAGRYLPVAVPSLEPAP